MARDKQNISVTIIHFSPSKSKGVCKSVLGAELFAFFDGFDIGYSIADIPGAIVNRKVDLTMYADSQSLYGLCISLAHTTERRLRIDLSLIRATYERREITIVVRIAGSSNRADDLTKADERCGALAEMVATNKFDPVAQS